MCCFHLPLGAQGLHEVSTKDRGSGLSPPWGPWEPTTYGTCPKRSPLVWFSVWRVEQGSCGAETLNEEAAGLPQRQCQGVPRTEDGCRLLGQTWMEGKAETQGCQTHRAERRPNRKGRYQDSWEHCTNYKRDPQSTSSKLQVWRPAGYL